MNPKLKNKLYSYTCVVQLFFLTTYLALTPQLTYAAATCDKPSATATTLPTTSSMKATIGKCGTICAPSSSESESEGTDLTTATISATTTTACGPAPTPGSPDVPITSNGTKYDNYAACALDVSNRYGQSENYCKAMKLADTSMIYGAAAASAYTAAAIGCFALCAMVAFDDWSPATFAIKAASVACAGLGIAAAAADVAGMIHVNTQGASDLKSSVKDGGYEEWWSAQLGTGVVSSVVGSAAAASAVLGTRYAISSTAATGAKASCIAGGIFVAAAALKWGHMGVSHKTANSLCCTVEELPGFGAYTPPPLPSSIPDPISAPNGGGGGGSPASGGSTTSNALSPKDIEKIVKGNDLAFPTGMLSAATAGPMSGLLNSLDNKDQIPDLLQQAGMGLKDIASKLGSGQSPASIINSAIPNLPENISNALKAAEQGALDGTLGFPGLGTANSAMSSGGSGGAKGSSSSDTPSSRFASFGSRGGASDFSPREMSFSAAKVSTSSTTDNSDIWHSNWNGSIFQIITNKLNKNQNRIEQLEWSTPLNRALMGIPNKPSTTKGSGK